MVEEISREEGESIHACESTYPQTFVLSSSSSLVIDDGVGSGLWINLESIALYTLKFGALSAITNI